MSKEKAIFVFVLSSLLAASVVVAAPQFINLTITNTTITAASGGYNITFNNTPSNQTFQFNTTDCISTAGNFTVNITTISPDYNLIKQNTQCNLNYTCPQPTCPQPSCPVPTCPVLDYAQLLSAIDASSEKTIGKLLEVNSSISSSNKGMSFKFPSYTPYILLGLAALAFFNKDKWLPKLKKATEKIVSKQEDEAPK